MSATLTEKRFSYVVGFMFNPARDLVLLIEKDRPVWQAGKLNGVGGKLEDGEDPMFAMVREFKEETGIETRTEDWALRLYTEDLRTNAEIYTFTTIGKIEDAKQMESEKPVIIEIDKLPDNVVPNLKWSLPFLRQNSYIGNLVGPVIGGN